MRDTLAISGALFALLVAATTFTLVLRVLGTDRLATDLLESAPGGPAGAVLTLLAILAASALVLDAFEIVFVVVPIAMPGALMRAPPRISRRRRRRSPALSRLFSRRWRRSCLRSSPGRD